MSVKFEIVPLMYKIATPTDIHFGVIPLKVIRNARPGATYADLINFEKIPEEIRDYIREEASSILIFPDEKGLDE